MILNLLGKLTGKYLIEAIPQGFSSTTDINNSPSGQRHSKTMAHVLTILIFLK